ncbi:uncharacterized protein GLRG_00224 [Colletotrichum graminicola M1.001]|uniref:Ecp2 effector protein domain-containing protein n=1 Tax=Colletotrichum graminicola (strain M1.001 / M2 / FGSC 10212) TaxID=645133 RepID=E3Q1X9_COLGM|nr:uncharacterized protein GLRG_00224 [Colletotrichum graminicola M1.001]EFQ25080.1 hypothetical protein GLRG_00224 [Colletotrichum graminicola M1.001]
MRANYLVALLSALPAILVTALADLHTDVHEFTPKWEFEPFPGQKITLNGTVEQVVAELAQINPDYSPFAPALGDGGLGVEKRQKAELFPADKVLCLKPGWDYVHESEAKVGIHYLKTVKGRPRGDPGPGNCGRVSCGYSSAIWFCNDNTHHITIDSFAQIAEMVEAIGYHCTTRWRRWYSGQAFHPTDNWNVYIHRDSC